MEIIFKMAKMGTNRIMPGNPQIVPPIMMAIITMIRLRFSLFTMIRGSSITRFHFPAQKGQIDSAVLLIERDGHQYGFVFFAVWESARTGNGVSTQNQNIDLKNGITIGGSKGFTDPGTRLQTIHETAPDIDNNGL
jgi:hypothetical protein